MWGFDSFEGFPKGSDKDSEAFRAHGRPLIKNIQL